MADTAVQSPQSPGRQDSKERFFRYFQQEVAALRDRMDHLAETSTVGGERTFAIEHCLAGIERLSNSVKDASSYIPAYDQRTYGEAIKALAEKLQNVRNSFAPPKKFQFKSGRKAERAAGLPDIIKTSPEPASPGRSARRSPVSPFSLAKPSALSPLDEKPESEVVKAEDGTTDRERKDSGTSNSAHAEEFERGRTSDSRPSTASSCPLTQDGTTTSAKSDMSSATSPSISITNKFHSHTTLASSAALSSNSGTVSNISHSVVDMSQLTITGQPLAGLILKNIKDSLIICGQVAGPVHITDVKNTVLVTACRQFRMHTSSNVDVYLHCSSRPIIEDCDRIRFAKLPDVYTTKELRLSTNQWNQIDDFKWLKAEPSPHFCLLDDAEKIGNDVWIGVAPGGAQMDVDEILKKVGRA